MTCSTFYLEWKCSAYIFLLFLFIFLFFLWSYYYFSNLESIRKEKLNKQWSHPITIDFVFIETNDDDKAEKELPSLDRFLARNTSEDNASFEQIMDLAEDKERMRHSWLYEAEAEFKQVFMY